MMGLILNPPRPGSAVSNLFFISMVLLGIGGGLLLSNQWKQSTDKYFLDYGIAAKGELVQKIEDIHYYTRRGRPYQETLGYYLRIAYQHPELGRKISKVEVPYESYMKVFDGTPLTIRYLRDDPDQIRIEGLTSVSSWTQQTGWVLFLLGLAGISFLGVKFVRFRLGIPD